MKKICFITLSPGHPRPVSNWIDLEISNIHTYIHMSVCVCVRVYDPHNIYKHIVCGCVCVCVWKVVK